MTTHGSFSLGILEGIFYYILFKIHCAENDFKCSMSRMFSILLLSVNKNPFCLSPFHVFLFLCMKCFITSLLCWPYSYFLHLMSDHFHFTPNSSEGAVLYIGINRLNWLLVVKKVQCSFFSSLVLYALTEFPVRWWLDTSVNQAWQKTLHLKKQIDFSCFAELNPLMARSCKWQSQS